MTAAVLVVGLDAVEAPLLERLCDEGRLPVLAGLRARAAAASLRPACMDLLPGAIWRDLTTGMSAGRHGDYFPDRLHTGDARLRPIDAHHGADAYYWTQAAAAGRRVAVVDQPLIPPIRSVPGLTVVSEWHVHDQLWGRGSTPARLLADLEARHRPRSLDRCDTAPGRSAASCERWLDHLLDELRVKTDMAIDLLDREPWDCFAIAYSDGHCVGHQLWDADVAVRPAASPRLHGAVGEVYGALDAALGRLVAAARSDVTVLFTSHGMGPYIGGPQLLTPILQRLGLGDPRRIPPRLRRLVPATTYQRLAARFPRAAQRAAGLVGPRGFHRPGTVAMAVPNNRIGAIRFNVAGREPAGSVAAEELPTRIAELADELRALRQPGSGELIVDEIVLPIDAYGPDHHPDLPDLLVRFRRDLGPLQASEGPRSGRVEVGIRRPDYPRTGDHTSASRLWVAAPRGTTAADLGSVDALDLAPTLLGLLGLPPGPAMEGRPIDGALAHLGSLA